ncbi:protein FATTY ACID EXPORT 1, chloroplastic isoform X3 [Juglans microcarpa x Juglans regia]|uniref:protein FATTY ACID EXPORT 1, chloroplastic isoform X3 n=1 Tax=Juglans microcarpa x Juglans regia TaxID=2249226 RepID=UPI001B7E137F|nr:protein FATTY ACID EXPORT 1, chloroplastic isoform X3 [Juglans microcarpa x Juglans regia]
MQFTFSALCLSPFQFRHGGDDLSTLLLLCSQPQSEVAEVIISKPITALKVLMSLEGRQIDASSSEIKTSVSYTADASKSQGEGIANSYPDFQDVSVKSGTGEPALENGVIEQKRAAKIHDFCFGIPFGGLVLSGGLLGFVFSRNPVTLSTGVLFGGALLALSTFSLKIWRQGKSSAPFILGQADKENISTRVLCCY